MNKGKQFKSGYATIDGGINYREIAEAMTKAGYPMQHSSARNYLLRAMTKFATAFMEHLGVPVTQQKLDEVIRTPSFQEAIYDIFETYVYSNKT